MLTNPPFSIPLTPSTTWRRPNEMRHAVVPGKKRCLWGSSVAAAVTVPSQHSEPARRGTSGALRDPRIVHGRARERSRPAWKGHLDLVAPTKENFALVFERRFIDTIVKRMDSNEEIFKKILDDEAFRRALGDFYLARVYGRLRETG